MQHIAEELLNNEIKMAISEQLRLMPSPNPDQIKASWLKVSQSLISSDTR